MARQTVMTILGLVLASACAARPARAQTQATTTHGTQQSENQEQSAAAMAQEASNPFAASWLMQIQQNNNWVKMPFGQEKRVQSNLQFQPLLSVRLTESSMLIVRPVLTMVNSLPTLDENGRGDRTTGFGDTVLGFAIPRPFFGGKLMVGVGPTFIFPTASQRELGQDTWQVGPDLGAVLQLKNVIAYAFAQQWFKVGGDGRNTSQMNTVFNVTRVFKSGWTIGSQPTLSVDWEAPEGERVTLPIGAQVGKMCKCGGTPTLLQVQFQYYAIRPSGAGPKWNVQLQVTPTLASPFKKPVF